MEKRKHEPQRDLCARMHEDDGINPRHERKDSASRDTTRKDRQLCRQVMVALAAALQGEAGSPLLREILVSSVEPAPDASRLRVLVQGDAVARVGAGAVLQELRRARGFLRMAIGAAISRKRVPDLVFAISAGEEAGDAQEL
jgi:ribosome-binding factor A